MKGHSGSVKCLEIYLTVSTSNGMTGMAATAIDWTALPTERIVLVADIIALRSTIFEGMKGGRSVPTERPTGSPLHLLFCSVY